MWLSADIQPGTAEAGCSSWKVQHDMHLISILSEAHGIFQQ